MGVLDGFETVYSDARQTFGHGTPQDGSQFDKSSQLRRMQSTVHSARPGSHWTGSAADAYSGQNEKHGRRLGALADLDTRLRTEIDRSSQVVADGRRKLDAVRQWVHDAASTVPPGRNRERMLHPIVSRGAAEIADVVKKSNADLSSIAGRVRNIGGDYQMLGDGPNLAPGSDPKDPKDPKDPLGITDMEEEEIKRRAQQDVKAALDGDKGAIQRVQNVLNTITPQQQVGQPKLNAEQQAYLSQMQAQQKLRSVDQLKEAADRGAKGIMADSWQLMSNPALEFPKTESVDGALQSDGMVKGGFGQLPNSVQSVIQSPGIDCHQDLQKITDIVNSGNAGGYFQHSTDLDRGLMHKVADMMENSLWRSDDLPIDVPRPSWVDEGKPPHAELERVAQDVFRAVANDHVVVHDAVTGNVTPGSEFGEQFKVNGDHFMYNLTHEDWDDGGASAGAMFDWIDDSARGPEAQIAGETAKTLADYLGGNQGLNSLNGDNTVGLYGTHSLGAVNPGLVQGFAEGLSPYVNNIAGTEGGISEFGGILDNGGAEDGTLAKAKNLFTVLNGDPGAAEILNGAAYGQALLQDTRYAENPVPGETSHALYDSATLRALVDVGMENNHDVEDKNRAQIDAELYAAKSAAFDFGLESLQTGTVIAFPGGGGEVGSQALSELGSALKDGMIGPAPPASGQPEPIARFASQRAEAEMLNTLNAVGTEIKNLPPEYRGPGGTVLSFEQMYAKDNTITPGEYAEAVNRSINETLGFDFQDDHVKNRYDQVTANKTPEPRK